MKHYYWVEIVVLGCCLGGVWSLLAVIAHEAEESESKRVRDVDRTLDAAYGPRCRCRQMEPLVGTCMLRVVLLLCSVTHTLCSFLLCAGLV